MRKLLIAVLLSMMATVSYAQTVPTTPTAETQPTGVKPKWTDKSKNSSGNIIRARVGESESKMVKVETSSPNEIQVNQEDKMVELTIDYKGRALWIIHNDNVVSRSGTLDGVNTCLINVSDLAGTKIKVSVIGVIDGNPALLQEYLVSVNGKVKPPPVIIDPPVIDPPDIKPPEVIDPVDPPTPVVNPALVDKLQDAVDLDAADKKITTEAISALQKIYLAGSKQPKTTVAELYKWLTDQYNSDANKTVLSGNAKNLRTVINGILAEKVSPFNGATISDANWATVKSVLASLADSLTKVKVASGLTDPTAVVFVSDKNKITQAEASVRSSTLIRTWLNDNKLKSEFLYLDNKYVKDKMSSVITKYGTPSVMVINNKGEYKAFKMPLTDEETIKVLKEKTGK